VSKVEKQRTQVEIDEDRREMAQSIVDQERLDNLDDAKRFARAWIETAARHATNEAYYHDERDALLRLLVAVRPFLDRQAMRSLIDRVDARVREAEALLEPVAAKGEV
jgi:hypothetical protein